MHFTTWTIGASVMAAMMMGAWTHKLDYADSLQPLPYGHVALQGNSTGAAWFNITNYPIDKLPYIQKDLGIFSLDNFESLQFLIELAEAAAFKEQYGDLVYLYNAFAMNGHAEYVKVSSKPMQQGLLWAVTPPNSDTPDQNLIKLYADTSSSPYISQTFLGLQVQTLATVTSPSESSPRKRYTGQTCDNRHQAGRSACNDLVNILRNNPTIKTGGPRDICFQGCCVSWSRDATFQYENLAPAADLCLSYCGGDFVSCKIFGVELQGTILNQCLSNRPTGCWDWGGGNEIERIVCWAQLVEKKFLFSLSLHFPFCSDLLRSATNLLYMYIRMLTNAKTKLRLWTILRLPIADLSNERWPFWKNDMIDHVNQKFFLCRAPPNFDTRPSLIPRFSLFTFFHDYRSIS